VTTSDQAHAFGFPNEFLGLAGYAVATAVGLAMLAGAEFKKWFWKLVTGGLFFSVVFISWLQFQTLYRIGALCLFCMIVWAVTIPMFIFTLLYSLKQKHIKPLPILEPLTKIFIKFPGETLVAWYLIIVALILKRFWYYWSTVL
jgi:uncharacterized membrane protein